jgi:hypothetical protein
MRLMIGTKERPSLLVELEQEHSLTHFEFWVINGAWHGTYTNEYITIWHPDRPWTNLEKMEILTNNQDRLRGNYQDVFDNFGNPDYVAPKPEKVVLPACWDDDIPF